LKPIPPIGREQFLTSEPFIALANATNGGDRQQINQACQDIAISLGDQADIEIPCESMCALLEREGSGINAKILNACSISGETRAVSLSHFAKNVFGDHLSDDHLRLASRGLLIARGLCDTGGRSSLPSLRLHWFFRNIEGLWACTMPNCQGASDEQDTDRTTGRLFNKPQVLCGGEGSQHRVLEMLYCEQCGTVFFGGSRLTLPDNNGWELLNTDPDIEGIPDRQAARFVDRRSYREYAIFWPIGKSSLHEDARSQWQQAPVTEDSKTQARWLRASLDIFSSRVSLDSVD
jgi:hypothetical protein